MTEYQLAMILKDMYQKGEVCREQTTMIHLFGIKYSSSIRDYGLSIKKILEYAQLPESYKTEINKGMKLSKYVVEK